MTNPIRTAATVGLLLFIVPMLVATDAQAQSAWKQHDMNRSLPPVVAPPEQSLPVPAPADAIVLFDGSDVSQWEDEDRAPTKWEVADGAMISTVGAGSIQTKQAFGDLQLHVEWAAPVPPQGSSQGRGNSGVYLMGLYEVQILDSYDNETYADGQAAAIYGQYQPLVNVARPPGEWQTFDISFRAPRFGPDGVLLEPARMTVVHNGVVVHNNVELVGPTMWLQSLPYEPHPEKLPLLLQDHRNPVRFRNIWLRELPQDEPMPSVDAYNEAAVTLTAEVLDLYVGRYGRWTVRRDGDRLMMHFYGPRYLELVPHSATRFSLAHTAGFVVFELDDEGIPEGVTFHYGGETTPARRRE